jgi:hypothetical protein
MATKPVTIRVRSYQVGFGDCYLLTFRYRSGMEKHVLIDFGTTGLPKRANRLPTVARTIRDHCGGKLHAIVATHRHKDHISGFATSKGGNGPGDIIASCEPDLVVQPWTEDPDAAPDARSPRRQVSSSARAFVAALADMQVVARAITELAADTDAPSETLRFLGDTNIANRSAIENLIRMGRSGRAEFVSFDSSSGLESVLPGVRVNVLGPPTIEQSEEVLKQRHRDEGEFWHLQAMALAGLAGQRRARGNGRVFPSAEAFRTVPIWSRWIVDRMNDLRADALLEIVRTVDSALNNTSVILLFRVGRNSLLFPGDAQIENWSYALSHGRVRRLLRSVDLYKVGHHGSLNATPKTMWELFRNRSTDENGPTRMYSLVSTMGGKHGHASRRTEVPRRALVDALRAETHFITTQDVRATSTFWRDVEIDVNSGTMTRPT